MDNNIFTEMIMIKRKEEYIRTKSKKEEIGSDKYHLNDSLTICLIFYSKLKMIDQYLFFGERINHEIFYFVTPSCNKISDLLL